MRTKLTHLLASLVIAAGFLALTPAGWAQQAPAGQKTEAGTNTESVLRYDYKPHFTTPIKAPIDGSWMNGIQCGAVKVETNDYYAKPNALRLDCSVFTSSILVVSFRIPSLSAYKGKPLVFRSQVKYLKGSGALRLNMACWGSGKSIHSNISFQGKKGK